MKERTRSITRYVIPGAIIVLVVIVTIWWFSSPSRSIARSPQQDVRSTTVSRGTMQVTVSVSGHLEPRSSVDLTFESPGEVAEVAVDVGERVSAGEPLARLDTRQLAVQVHQAEAALEMIEAQLAQAKAGPRPQEVASAEANLRAAEAQVNRAAADLAQVTRGASEAQIAAAEAQVAAAELQYRVTLIAHDRVMQQTEDSTRREQARNDLYAAEKALAAAQAQLDELLAGADAESIQAMRANLAAAQAQRDAAQAQLDLLKAGATPKQIEELEGQVAQAQASLAMAELALERATLRAPFDGIVAAIYITPGEMTPVGLPAITLLDDSAFRLVAQADEMDVGQLIPGQSTQVTMEAFPDVTLTGRLEHIAPAATMEGGVVYYELTIVLDPTDLPLRADMTANATILVDELEDVLLLPTWVVRVDHDTGQTYVNQRVDGQVVRTDITVGVRHDGSVQILSGLSEGEEVIWVNESGFGFGGSGGE